MIGIWGVHSAAFLQVTAIATMIVFALPILLVPFGWARMFRWSIPDDSDLALYFGRCLGGVACVLGAFTFYVATQPALQPFFMRILIGVYVAMILIHIAGALQKVQPLTETIEIGFWAVLLVLTLCFYPLGLEAA